MADETHDELDRVLDAALAKYAAVEPRTGLEARVLANLRTERAKSVDRAWWRWALAGALAAVVVVAVALAWRSDRPSHTVVANHSPVTTQAPTRSGTQAASNRGAIRRATVHRPQPKVVMAVNPKLSQFPSPQPLSEQERLLEKYVAEYPEQAVLLARARGEALRQDQLEEMKAFPFGGATDADQRNNDSTER
jgi:hypothetical protein